MEVDHFCGQDEEIESTKDIAAVGESISASIDINTTTSAIKKGIRVDDTFFDYREDHPNKDIRLQRLQDARR